MMQKYNQRLQAITLAQARQISGGTCYTLFSDLDTATLTVTINNQTTVYNAGSEGYAIYYTLYLDALFLKSNNVIQSNIQNGTINLIDFSTVSFCTV